MKSNNTPLKDETGTTELAEDASSIPLTDANKAVLAAFTGTLDVYNKDITSLSGIEYLTGLTMLDCSVNSLTYLDVSQNTQLTELYCYSNRLTSLDISPLSKITFWKVGNQNDAAGNSGATIELKLKETQKTAQDGTDYNSNIKYIIVP
jgi:Leucine-rich repeat (LRR) protein